MVTLLKRRLRRKEEEGIQPEPATRVDPDRDRILLLVPVEGGFSFQMFAFPTAESVSSYVRNHFPYRADHLVVFRAAHQLSRAYASGEAVETVVLVRDVERPGIVHLYSFVDMETANAFIRAEAMRGLPLHYVLLFWAEPVSLDGSAHDPTPNGASQEQEEQAAPFQLQPIPPVELPLPTPVPEPVKPAAVPDMPEKEPLRGDANPFLTAGTAPREEQMDFVPPSASIAPAIDVAPSPEVAPAPAAVPAVGDTPVVPFAPVMPLEPPAPAPASPYDPALKRARRGYVSVAGEAVPADETPARAPATSRSREQLDGLMQNIRAWPGWDGLGPHIASAMRLRWQTYDDVRKDPHATGRAWLLAGTAVAAAALAAANQGPLAFFAHGLLAAIGAAVFTGLIYVLGTVVFGGKLNDRDFTLFLQRLGLAAAPGFLLVLGAFPIYGPLFLLGALLWVMLTAIKATELSLELDRQSAAYTVIFAWLALFAVTAVLPNIVV